ncbi:hypothetical protein LEL_08323 [Akanthomyces lecanii RCEF 1005]|uniref:Carboxymethylenebutenolidase n=1 Tax=Akanthomyces lecanii RCEF 1005 TaxID=1081108 RepID=A0A162JWQ5_CORDF|nr:hypothetical protein LEL_08323 [Akanthomyces lecanii RCEF 1005]
MPPPTRYNPDSPNECNAPALPSAARVRVSRHTILQPPLSRRGTGPGLILVQHAIDVLTDAVKATDSPSLDPEPVQKWAEEGFAVAAVTLPRGAENGNFTDELIAAATALKAHNSVTSKDGLGFVIYTVDGTEIISGLLPELRRRGVVCALGYGSVSKPPHHSETPLYIHMAAEKDSPATVSVKPSVTVATYPNVEDFFFDPRVGTYNAAAAAIAHTRSLVFLRKHLGGPHFDLEAIWEEHTYWEFEKRSVAQTMATMVAEPYVNHVPTMTGGMGREKLTSFYRDHFIFWYVANPRNNEFIFTCTHTTRIPWLLPNVPPTNAKLSVPMVAVVNVRGDRLYHEHIWWDQAGVLLQAGILPTHVDREDGSRLRLPVAGAEAARLLADERDGVSNEMMLGAAEEQQRR